MIRLIFTFWFLFVIIHSYGSDLKAYQIFDKEGNTVSFEILKNEALENQIVLFGELHNNPISHWLQLELSIALHTEKKEKLLMGLEMFEADNQLLIDEYFSGLINERSFQSEARLWNNYQTDIKPLLEFARANQLRFIATNIPRRYASMVNRGGFEALDELSIQGKSYIAPLPVAYDPELPAYKAMLDMGMPAHANDNFPKAQAIKDATMAHFILKNLSDDDLLIHFHGTYHSRNYEGIVWYLLQSDSELKILTIDTIEQDSVEVLLDENKGTADYILVIPSRMTKTY